MKLNRQTKRLLAALAVLAVGWVAQQAGFDLSALTNSNASSPSRSAPPARSTPVSSVPSASGSRGSNGAASAANERIETALARRESGFMITLDAQVARTLPDDNQGSRHQRFLIETQTGRSILVAHNIDLAKRLPLERGDAVRVRGQFEWNEKGGVLHWTHHDPAGRHEGGWIEHAGTRVE